MTKNTLLNIAILLCKIFKIGLVVIVIALTIFFVHLQIDKNYYKGKELQFNTKQYNYSISYKLKKDDLMEDKDVYTIDHITTGSLYINYLKYIAVFALVFMALKEFQSVMMSVKRVETFGMQNVKSFRRIGMYLLIYIILISYSSISFELGGFKGFRLSIGPFILVLVAFIMAEVFKEGGLLKQENDLTI
ncbi:DUF2975 domain-containing protein [Hyunsoonleella sp. 2307UL5-6]|uniref:DUF2975 domain-containing protein n=1 Tax=Hyunsoonleella sp. 2307UL5-6 TaxID=3384768 RepID=UPI0039BD07C7